LKCLHVFLCWPKKFQVFSINALDSQNVRFTAHKINAFNFHPKRSKTNISCISTEFLIKKYFSTHVIVGFCSILTWEHVEKISKTSSAWIARYELLNLQKSFFWLFEILGSCTSQGHICMKKCLKWWCFFGFILQVKLTTCLENF